MVASCRSSSPTVVSRSAVGITAISSDGTKKRAAKSTSTAAFARSASPSAKPHGRRLRCLNSRVRGTTTQRTLPIKVGHAYHLAGYSANRRSELLHNRLASRDCAWITDKPEVISDGRPYRDRNRLTSRLPTIRELN